MAATTNFTAQQLEDAINTAVAQATNTLRTEFSHELTQMQAKIDAKDTQLTSALALLTEASQTQQQQQQQQRPKPVLPDPPKLSEAKEYDAWLLQMKGKLHIDGNAIGTNEAQFHYVFSRLDTKLQDLVIPQMAYAEANQQWDHTTIFDSLDHVYEDVNKVQRAAKKLRSMRQGATDSIRSFLIQWEKNSYSSGATSQPDAVRIQQLRYAVNEDLQRKLDERESFQPIPEDYQQFVRLLLKLSYTGTWKPAIQNNNAGNNNAGNRSDAMDISAIGAITGKAASETKGKKVEFNTHDYIWTPQGRMAHSSTQLERELRRDMGLCVRCGLEGHRAVDCDLMPYNKVYDEED